MRSGERGIVGHAIVPCLLYHLRSRVVVITIGERHRKRISVLETRDAWYGDISNFATDAAQGITVPSVKSVSAKWDRNSSIGEETYHLRMNGNECVRH